MKSGWTAAIVTLLALTLAGPATAQTYSVYECKYVVRGMGGEELDAVFLIDAEGHAFTYDTMPGSDRPVLVPVSLSKSGKDQLIFAYAFDIPNVERRMTITARARVPKAGGASRIMLTALGFSGNPSGKGACKFSQNMRLSG